MLSLTSSNLKDVTKAGLRPQYASILLVVQNYVFVNSEIICTGHGLIAMEQLNASKADSMALVTDVNMITSSLVEPCLLQRGPWSAQPTMTNVRTALGYDRS